MRLNRPELLAPGAPAAPTAITSTQALPRKAAEP